MHSHQARVVVGDPRPLVRQTLLNAAWLAAGAEPAAVAELSEALDRGRAERAVLLLVGDPLRFGGDSYAGLVTRCTEHGMRLVVWTTGALGGEEVARAVSAGVHGYCSPEADESLLVDVLRAVLAGQRQLCPTAQALFLEHSLEPVPDAPALTPREDDVLRLVATGAKETAIARSLGVSPDTVHTHKRALLRKLGAANAAALVFEACRLGLLDLTATSLT